MTTYNQVFQSILAKSFVNNQNKRLRLSVAFLVCALLTACAPSMTQRIKVTVTVDDNGTLYTGSAVQQWICTATNNALAGMAIGGCTLKAEAIPIEIGNKGWVFMIFSMNPKLGCCDPGEYPGAIQKGRSREQPQLPWIVPLEEAPPFVRFRDITDRLSVEMVDPTDLSASFGDGVRVLKIEAQPSTDKLTKGKIKKVIPWISEVRGRDFDDVSLENKLTTELRDINFIWGL